MIATVKTARQAKKKEIEMKRLAKKVIGMITIDGKEFSDSKDWPYLWKKK